MIGDELRLKHLQTMNGQPWEKTGQVFKIPDSTFPLFLDRNCALKL